MSAILVEEKDQSIIIRFNRPEVRSPLSIAVLERLSKIIAEMEGRTVVERVIFTGIGDVFASGADLREIAVVDGNGAREFAMRGQALMNRISEMSSETIAAVNGICFGGALDLALACDRRIASPDALFSHPGASLGIITGWGGTQRLPRLVGEAIALEMLFTGKRLGANEALRLGLVDQVTGDPVGGALADLGST
jgi:enoyl-CoA hydratase